MQFSNISLLFVINLLCMITKLPIAMWGGNFFFPNVFGERVGFSTGMALGVAPSFLFLICRILMF